MNGAGSSTGTLFVPATNCMDAKSILVEMSAKQGKRPMDVLVIETKFLNEKNENVVTVRDVTLEFRDRA